MRRIYKYTLVLTAAQRLTLPADSKILSVETQEDKVVLYAMVDTTQKGLTEYMVEIVGTGNCLWDLNQDDFVGTVKLQEGRFMFHIFIRRVQH